MTLEQVLAVQGQEVLSIQGERSTSPITTSPAPYTDELTAREVEVLRVVA